MPIGDCTEPTEAELTAAGCPLSPPEPLTDCSAPAGTVCRYAIVAAPEESSATSRPYFTCQDETWSAKNIEYCGFECNLGAESIELAAGNCAARPVVACRARATRVVTPPAQELLNDTLQAATEACNGGPFATTARLWVQFSRGCAVAVQTAYSVPAATLSCLQGVLAEERWDCAEELNCAIAASFYF